MIEAINLTKVYGDLTAVNNISFSVNDGEILAFLGPNGAGKSTTMRMITGFVSPTSGTAKIMGKDILEEPIEAKRMIGYLPESAPNYKDLKVCEFLSFVAGIHGFGKSEIPSKVEQAMEMTDLTDVGNRLIDTLSKGYRQRVSFAQALIHNPPTLVLDEPTDGLDPNQKNEVRQLIRKISRDKSIILSTHILEEMEAVCDRAMIISHGEIVIDGKPEELARLSKKHNAVTVKYSEPQDTDKIEKARHLANVSKVEVNQDERTAVIYPKEGADISSDVFKLFSQEGFAPDSFTVDKGSMDEVFANLTARKHETKEEK